MFSKKKGFTASQSKLTSRRMRSATIGTHVQRRAHSSSRHMNADAVGFSNSRKKRRAARGVVDTLLPDTATRESSSEYARRVSRREFTEEVQRKARVRRIAVGLVAIVVVAVIAGGVGVATFFGSLDGKMGLADSNAKTALTALKEERPWYALLVADLGAASAALDEEGPDAFVLARVDEAAGKVTLVSLPPNLRVTLSDGKAHRLREAAGEGDAALITAVAGFAGVDIAHYVKTDAAGITALVDALGGVPVNVEQEVDDPQAGDTYLAPGEQTLDGNAALTFLRASNFKEGVEDQAKNQRAFVAALAERAFDREGALAFATFLDSVGGSFATDISAMDALGLAGSLGGVEAASVAGALVPGYESTADDVKYYVASSDAWEQMMEAVDKGEEPPTDKVAPTGVDRKAFKVEVRNGAGIAGGAAQAGELLTAEGFDVAGTGNADSDAFPETLVIYDGAEHEAQAQDVAASLGIGRVIQGLGYYEYETDVLVILGKDWKPVA
ncbi:MULTISPECIES: LCP family protein [Gordonibacter]|uniref:LCP family protein n=1 Tax=Gordonibacter faecis TaxID=3047475 RepID=A0ABT7DNA1_9ACTN|nr:MULTISPECIES: LCP family protein [unclassified Gordonibacter]MDJ1651009.1 LCP family protein [Gordonibacter sp. KGMB12511]HIW76973.1 LCP family protein [Candidatus Gordonibacter avicola]